MPVYEYECTACGNNFEVNQRMSDPPITSCNCGKEGQVRRLIGAGSGLIFKGSGFYITDYKKNGSSSSTTSNGKAGDGAGKKAEAKSSSSSSGSAPACGSGACGCPS